MFRIAETYLEKKQVMMYWEQQRKLAADIRDAYDKVEEDAYHSNFYQKILSYDTSIRPDFFSPLPKKLAKMNI
tara:strand:- start:277 stop:495 length:219 start_codon:yes stop_codon:yes gene_type:complete